MNTHSPLFLLAALGLLSSAAAAPDTSKWKCESCPYPKGTTAVVEAGVGATDQAAGAFANYTGYDRKGGHLVLGGSLGLRTDSGYYASAEAADLGLDTRSLSATSGHEGVYALKLAYAELPHWYALGAQTPFVGTGGSSLTLPAGYPAASTGSMPLATTLQSVDVGYKHKKFDLAGTFNAGSSVTLKVALRRDQQDGTRPVTSSFFSTAVQMAAPVNQKTDQLEVSAAYAARGLQGSVSYLLSQFKNDADALTWANPFQPVVPGATRGQLSRAPGNTLQQLAASAGYEITPAIRASGDVSVGRLTQDEAYIATSLTPSIAAAAAAVPATSLDGRVDLFNGNLRLTATPLEGLTLKASGGRDVRDNRSARLAYPVVAADVFLDSGTRTNTPFKVTRDRARLSADYRATETLRLSAGVDQDNRMRSYVEVVKTKETSVWGKAALQVNDELKLGLKFGHGERDHTPYGISTWFGEPENPLLRKYNLSRRQRDSGGVRADWAVNEKVSIGASVDYATDAYRDAQIGLQSGRSVNLAADLSAALTEQTQLTAWAQTEGVRSTQAGSQRYSVPDWSARNKDRFSVVGLGVKHAAIPDKLDVGGDVTISRSRSETFVFANTTDPDFPAAKVAVDSLRLFATYKLQEKLSITGSLWHEEYKSEDWHWDGIGASTVGNLLTLGQQPPKYRVNVVRVALRYAF